MFVFQRDQALALIMAEATAHKLPIAGFKKQVESILTELYNHGFMLSSPQLVGGYQPPHIAKAFPGVKTVDRYNEDEAVKVILTTARRLGIPAFFVESSIRSIQAVVYKQGISWISLPTPEAQPNAE